MQSVAAALPLGYGHSDLFTTTVSVRHSSDGSHRPYVNSNLIVDFSDGSQLRIAACVWCRLNECHAIGPSEDDLACRRACKKL